MSINFGGPSGSARVATGWTPSAADLDSGTVLAWFSLPTGVTAPSFFVHAGAASTDGYFYFLPAQILGGPIYGLSFLKRNAVALSTTIEAVWSTFPLLAGVNDGVGPVGGWFFVAVVWNCQGVVADQLIALGNRDELAKPPTSYQFRTVNGGTATAPTSALVVGNGSALNKSLQGGLAKIAVFPSTMLTLGQIHDYQGRTDWSADSPGVWYDLHSTSHLADLSGNGHNGTMGGTGYSNADDPALGVRDRMQTWRRK